MVLSDIANIGRTIQATPRQAPKRLNTRVVERLLVLVTLAVVLLGLLTPADAQIHSRWGSTAKLSRRNTRLVDRWGRSKTPSPGYSYPHMPAYHFDPFTTPGSRVHRSWGGYSEGGYPFGKPSYTAGVRSDLRGFASDSWNGLWGNDLNVAVDDGRWRPYWRRFGGLVPW